MQWIQDPSQSNVDNLNNVRRDASRHFRNKNKAYLKSKIEEVETNSKINNIRDLYKGINHVKKGYQPYHHRVPIILKSGSLNLLEPPEPVQACNAIALPLPLYAAYVYKVCSSLKMLIIFGRNM
jgi:hypothetical protein